MAGAEAAPALLEKATALPDPLPCSLSSVVASLLALQALAALQPSTAPIPAVRTCRKPLLQLTRRLTLPFTAWLDFAVAYGSDNRTIVAQVLEKAAKADGGQELVKWERIGVPALIAVAERAANSQQGTAEAARVLQAVAQSSPLLACSVGRAVGTLPALTALHRGASGPDTASTRYAVVSATCAFLNAGYLSPLGATQRSAALDPRSLIDSLSERLGFSHNASVPQWGASGKTSLIDLPFLADLEAHTGLGRRLEQVAANLSPNAGQTELYGLASWVQHHRPAPDLKDGRFLIPAFRAQHKGQPQGSRLADGEPGLDIEVTVASVLSVLSNTDASTVRRAIMEQPSRYGGSQGVEELVAAILEGRLEERQDQDEPDLLASRKNIFDDQAMDFSRLRRGKARLSGIMDDKSHLTPEVRARMIARAEAPSDSEGDSDTGPNLFAELDTGPSVHPVVDVFDSDYEEERGAILVRAGATEDVSSGDEAQEGGFSGTVTRALHLAYLNDPHIFDKASRGSKARAELRAATDSLSNDLLESWRVMFERDPKKDRILSKYEFRGNRAPTGGDASAEEGEEEDSKKQPGPTHNRGGRMHRVSRGSSRGSGGGRGRGDAGPSSGRGRGRGRGGSKMAHDRRVRGRDKKMQKMGAGPS